MNQNVCPKCQTPNIQNSPFCVSCGQSLATAQQAGYANNPPPAGSNAPNYSANQPGANTANPHQPPVAKKSRMGMWLAIIGGVLVLGVLALGVGALGIYYYISGRQTADNFGYNSAPANYNRAVTLSNTSSVNTTTVSTNSTTTVSSSSMSDEEKYRLFYAASKVGDQPLTVKVSKKIGIIDEGGKPTPYYKTFITGMFTWAAKDVEFVKKMDTKEKAREYVDSQMPGA